LLHEHSKGFQIICTNCLGKRLSGKVIVRETSVTTPWHRLCRHFGDGWETYLLFFTLPRGGCEVLRSACVYVSPLACLKTTRSNFAKFSVHINCGLGSVLLWRHCNTYVVYFRFCGWRYVFTVWRKYRHSELFTVTRQVTPLNCARGAKSVLGLEMFFAYTTLILAWLSDANASHWQ